MLMSLTMNPASIIISLLVILLLISDLIAGYKEGFLESSVKFLKMVIAMIIAYFTKAPLSKILYMNFPFFEIGGIFKGVSAVSILLYEVLAFFVILLLVWIILNIISSIIKLDEKILRAVSIIGVPNKIMGAIVGVLKSVIFLYFVLSLFFVVSNFLELDTGKSLGNYIVEIPVLKNTFGSVLDSFDQISDLAVEYENVQDKEKLNKESIDILLKYDIITQENLELLIKSGKVEYRVDNADEQKEMVKDLYETIVK